MTEQDLQAIEERWAKATPGPWEHENQIVGKSMPRLIVKNGINGFADKFIACGINDILDAAAIANAPTDIAALLAEVRRLNESNKARECCGNCKNHYYSQRFGISCPVHGDKIHPSNWCELWVSGKESEVADNG